MTKKEYAVIIGRETGLSKRDVLMVINYFLKHVYEDIINGNSINFREFGFFKLFKRRQKKYTDFKTKEVRIVPEKVALHFKPSSFMKEELKKLNPKDFKYHYE